MTRDELFSLHTTMCKNALDIMKKKNSDYAGGVSDPFANFRRTEAMGVCSTEQAFLVRMTDKMSRLSTFTNVGKLVVEDEGVQDTLLDLINYSILLAAYLEDKKTNKS